REHQERPQRDARGPRLVTREQDDAARQERDAEQPEERQRAHDGAHAERDPEERVAALHGRATHPRRVDRTGDERDRKGEEEPEQSRTEDEPGRERDELPREITAFMVITEDRPAGVDPEREADERNGKRAVPV